MSPSSACHPAAPKAADLPHLWLPYCQMQTAPWPVEACKTAGSFITLENGQRLVDGIASWWTACHGYNHPHLLKALTEQAALMPHVMFGGMIHNPARQLARRLANALPGTLNHVFFTDSGSVAMEVAVKMALQYHLNKGRKERHKLLAFRGGYHGDTMGMMAICDPEEGMHRLFGAALPQQIIADLPDTPGAMQVLEDLLARKHTEIAAMIIEPLVQGAGGMRFHMPDLLCRLRHLCDQYGILLIFDEVFTGFGRTGHFFACQSMAESSGKPASKQRQEEITPDIIALSKALTGGITALAATIARDAVFEAFLSDHPHHALMHGPTFMANPLACAVANASLDLFEAEPRLAQIQEIETQLRQELSRCAGLPHIQDVRVMGAIGVVELDKINDPHRLNREFLAENVWIRPFGNIVYLTPAFTIGSESLSVLTNAICHVLGR